jgi:hypothetical protein
MKTTRIKCALKIWWSRFCNWLNREASLLKREKLITKRKKRQRWWKKWSRLWKNCQRISHQFVENDEISRQRIDLKYRCQTWWFDWSHAKNDDECRQFNQLRVSFEWTKQFWIESRLSIVYVFALFFFKSIVHAQLEIILVVSSKYVFSEYVVFDYVTFEQWSFALVFY